MFQIISLVAFQQISCVVVVPWYKKSIHLLYAGLQIFMNITDYNHFAYRVCSFYIAVFIQFFSQNFNYFIIMERLG